MTNTISDIRGRGDEKPHFVLVPVFAQGHMIPMVDMAHLLADRGAAVTFVTTPANAARMKAVVDRAAESNLAIQFVSLRFPCTEVGLPDGCENFDSVPSRDLLPKFMAGCIMLREPLIQHLRDQQPGPSCIITNAANYWTRDVAREFDIPRLTFNAFGCFPLLCRHIIQYNNVMEDVLDENLPVVVPGLPHRIEITKAQAPSNFGGSDMISLRKMIMDVELEADGVVVNSFAELEPSYVEYYQKVTGKKVWTVGPLSLYSQNVAEMGSRGNKASIDEDRCLRWLDSMSPNSVMYVSFGSLACTPPPQIVEIGLGLEASNRPFIWVIRAGNKSAEVEEWLAEGFEERTSGRGLIIRGWAPQLMILSHSAIGGFITHCGWNSMLESVSAGVPMITWPHFADQFLNEKLIVQVLGVGIDVGVKVPFRWGTDDNEVVVRRGAVAEAVRRVIGEDEEGRGMRERAKGLAEKAKAAMAKGGSSYDNIAALVQQVEVGMLKGNHPVLEVKNEHET